MCCFPISYICYYCLFPIIVILRMTKAIYMMYLLLSVVQATICVVGLDNILAKLNPNTPKGKKGEEPGRSWNCHSMYISYRSDNPYTTSALLSVTTKSRNQNSLGEPHLEFLRFPRPPSRQMCLWAIQGYFCLQVTNQGLVLACTYLYIFLCDDTLSLCVQSVNVALFAI